VPLIKISLRVELRIFVGIFLRCGRLQTAIFACFFRGLLPLVATTSTPNRTNQQILISASRCISNLFNIVRTNVNELHIVRKDSIRDSKKLCVPDKRVRIRIIVSLHRPRAGIFSRFARLQPDVPPRRGIYRILHRIGER